MCNIRLSLAGVFFLGHHTFLSASVFKGCLSGLSASLSPYPRLSLSIQPSSCPSSLYSWTSSFSFLLPFLFYFINLYLTRRLPLWSLWGRPEGCLLCTFWTVVGNQSTWCKALTNTRTCTDRPRVKTGVWTQDLLDLRMLPGTLSLYSVRPLMYTCPNHLSLVFITVSILELKLTCPSDILIII